MKLKDLKVGEEYAAGSKRYPDRVTLLSVGGWVPAQYNGPWMHGTKAAHEKAGAIGCRVQRANGYLDVIMPAQIHCTWAEHEANEAQEEAAKAKTTCAARDRADRATELAERLDLLLSKPMGRPIAHAYRHIAESAEQQDVYLDGLTELVALAERAGRGEG